MEHDAYGESMSETIRLNLGCGEFPLDDYVNVDLYVDGKNVIKGDFREMTFENVIEVQMQHVLEHLPWADSLPVLKRVKSWMTPGGKIVVEVPDMVQIMAVGSRHDDWYAFVYGSQQHEGEFHKAGFTAQMLWELLARAEFHDIEVKVYASTHPYRTGLPCLEGTAYA